jgi:hypothetical protein
MRRIVTILVLLCCITSLSSAKGRSGGHSSRPAKSAKVKKAKQSKSKPVHVRGYTRKDGTYVAPYDRNLPGTADRSASVTTTSTHPYRRDYMADGFTPHGSVTRDKHGRIKRSRAARAEFMRSHPCPATGKTGGRCPGYIVDHVHALECGGPDAPSNMQWQTSADAKAKDKLERQCRI